MIPPEAISVSAAFAFTWSSDSKYSKTFVSKNRLVAFIRLQSIEYKRCREATTVFTKAREQFPRCRLTLDLERSSADYLDLHLVAFLQL
jgi:hypothetical protein